MPKGQVVQLAPEKYGGLMDEQETAAYLGYGKQLPDADMLTQLRHCADMLLPALSPRYMFVPVRLLREGADAQGTLAADFGAEKLVLPGKAIRAHLGETGLAVAACLTLGEAVDERIDKLQKESMLDALLTDALANAAVERLRMELEQDVKETLGLAVGWLFGIGYEDFPLTLQHDFLRCMAAKEGIGLSVNGQGILSPLKSVTGFLDIRDGFQKGEKRCDGRCGMCQKREECRFFKGAR